MNTPSTRLTFVNYHLAYSIVTATDEPFCVRRQFLRGFAQAALLGLCLGVCDQRDSLALRETVTAVESFVSVSFLRQKQDV